eukprot:134264-Chlamydomonas_euryale.AAC.6
MAEIVGKQDLAGLIRLDDIASTSGSRLKGDASGNANAPWVEKFRPRTLDEVAAHTEIIDTSE